MRILVVCGAGASSTFVARRLARAADATGLALSTEAGTEHTALTAVGIDLVLIGPHLSDRSDHIRTALSGRTHVVDLPDDVFTDLDGSRTLRLVRDAMGAPHNRKGTP